VVWVLIGSGAGLCAAGTKRGVMMVKKKKMMMMMLMMADDDDGMGAVSG
jgi:hypothetical protein